MDIRRRKLCQRTRVNISTSAIIAEPCLSQSLAIVVSFVLMQTHLVHLYSYRNLVVNPIPMKNKFIKIGAVGSGVTALCCFTPILVWFFTAIGLSVVVAYLDYVLFPLLGIFIFILLMGITRHGENY